MTKRTRWVEIGRLPPKVRWMLGQFQANFGYSHTAYTVTYYRDDAVFVQLYGPCDAYLVARFIHNTPGVYLELEASAWRYWTVKLYCSPWLVSNELPRRLDWARAAASAEGPLPGVRVRAEAA